MEIRHYLLEQLHMHPSAQPQDVVKLCYQAAFGAEHLLRDPEKAKAYLQEEFDGTEAREVPLYEPLSDGVCRVSLAAWKYHGLPVDWLFSLFAAAPAAEEEREGLFLEYLKQAEALLEEASLPLSSQALQAYLQEYLKGGIRPVHHSEAYREAEQPAYRVADRKYTRLFPVLQKAAERKRADRPCIIAIDGRAASGKTTMAEQLRSILNADVVQMDDFFLPLELRTQERLAEAGGNVHYERFREEVLPFLLEKAAFSYRIFDCGRMDYNGERTIGGGDFRIVEGSYSAHPIFGAYADFLIFSDVDEEEQMRRIRKRNGEQMAEMFRTRWIPMEEAYFRAYQTAEKAEIRME